MQRIILHLVPGLVCAFGVCGCGGSSRHDVTGKVTYNGVSLDSPGGKIVFVGPRETQVVAEINPDGSYRALQIPAGLNRIAVYYPNPEYQVSKRLRLRPKEGEETAHSALQPPFLTPSRYASVNTSGLSVDVKKGTVFDAILTAPPGL